MVVEEAEEQNETWAFAWQSTGRMRIRGGKVGFESRCETAEQTQPPIGNGSDKGLIVIENETDFERERERERVAKKVEGERLNDWTKKREMEHLQKEQKGKQLSRV
jgi:hypothetical protein